MSKETTEDHNDLHRQVCVDNGTIPIAGKQWENKSLKDIARSTYKAGVVVAGFKHDFAAARAARFVSVWAWLSTSASSTRVPR